jgi:hypothetical protein
MAGAGGNQGAVQPRPCQESIAVDEDRDEYAETVDVPPLCPRCASAPPIEGGRTGFCEPCTEEATTERLIERDAVERCGRRDTWTKRTLEARRRHDVVKQERHRLLTRMRPRAPVPALDPLELGNLALMRIQRARGRLTQLPASVPSGGLKEELDHIEELVRALAWGPAKDPR